jgi:4a-hydroxytetrahydrobiopterin dehydratase
MTPAKLKTVLSKLPGWNRKGKKITKHYVFSNFEDAFTFMTRCALEIEKRNHHPEWFNVYNKVTVELSTHSAGGVTVKDIELAKIMDRIAALFVAKG